MEGEIIFNIDVMLAKRKMSVTELSQRVGDVYKRQVFDLQYREDRHYYNATRRDEEDLVAAKSTEEFKKMLPDAVSCVVTVSYTHLDVYKRQAYRSKPVCGKLTDGCSGYADSKEGGAYDLSLIHI